MRFLKGFSWVIGTFFLGMLPLEQTLAQCAMCRTTVANNISHGEIGIGAGLNFGILYLLVAPYLMVSLIAFFWYRRSKANSQKQKKSNPLVK